MSNLVHNERIKLTAAWLNTLSGGLMAAGVFTPVAAFVLGVSAFTGSRAALAALSVACLAIGFALHWMARRMLGKLLP